MDKRQILMDKHSRFSFEIKQMYFFLQKDLQLSYAEKGYFCHPDKVGKVLADLDLLKKDMKELINSSHEKGIHGDSFYN